MKKEIYCRVWTKDGCQHLNQYEWLMFNKKMLHRIDGPAIETSDGTKMWWVDGLLHRISGPAVELANKTFIWCINGHPLNNKNVEDWVEENNIDLETREGQVAFKLRWIQ